jgi:hypothetical protein
MRTIIAGTRTLEDYSLVAKAMLEAKAKGIVPTVVLSGTARGIDQLGEKWAEEHGVPIERYPAPWDKYGKAAGTIRNTQMAEKANAVVLIWDGKSSGTKDMRNQALSRGLKVHTLYI